MEDDEIASMLMDIDRIEKQNKELVKRCITLEWVKVYYAVSFLILAVYWFRRDGIARLFKTDIAPEDMLMALALSAIFAAN